MYAFTEPNRGRLQQGIIACKEETAMKTLVTVVLAALAVGLACAQTEWKVGRATFYGTDGWSIHQGSCGFYYTFEVCLTLLLPLCFVSWTLALM